MKRSLILIVSLITIGGSIYGLYFNPDVAAKIKEKIWGGSPDIPDFAQYKVDKQDFMLRRSNGIALLRGLDEDSVVDPQARPNAIREMENQERAMTNGRAPQAAWTEIGPNPIPNAQVDTPPVTSASGRVIAIAVHPTNPNLVYVGTAQGGLYRTTDGGTNWTRLLDGALSLAIGAIAIAPSQPETIYVGTGEANFSADSFFGVGVYRIDNASTTATVTGPFNDDPADADIFTGRSVAEILVHPTDPATIFVASGSGVGGIGSVANNVLPSRGIYRSTNATSADPTFTKLTGLESGNNFAIRDMVLDPLNPNLLVCNLVTNGGGIYVSTDALSAAPTFTRRVTFTSTDTNELTAEFAIQHTVGNANPTIYAATGNGGGRVLINTDGGTTWTQQIDNNFCTPQCFYDIAIDVDPTNPANVFIGGAPALVFGRSTNSGVTFTNDAATSKGLHADSHAIAVAPSLPTTIYFGSDGGIYKTTDSGTSNWTSLNNSQFTATQFMSIATHSTDPNFSIGGTQDNGTNFYQPGATWTRADFGDGGFALIDQTDTSTTIVDMYHTYFNQTTLQGYGYVPGTATATEGNWAFRGCQASGATTNGINCTGTVLFYAPLEQGPAVTGSLGNTIYYGSDRLYRSADTGLTHTVVSQNPITSGVAISSIGISPANDNVRVVGQTNGGIFGTTTGATTLTNLDPSNLVPNNYVARVVIDPNNVNTAYVTLAAFGVANVWKTTTLSSRSAFGEEETNFAPTWTAANNGLPQVPVSAFIVDPTDSNRLYAGTDIGVYTSADGGANWNPFGTGLPRVAVFDMAFAPGTPRQVRIATHGRGLWQIPVLGPTAAAVSVAGRVLTAGGRGVASATVTLTDADGNSRQAFTNSFGYYRFYEVGVGRTYSFTVSAKRYKFQPQIIAVTEEMENLNFTQGN